jgi:hypothetical protein
MSSMIVMSTCPREGASYVEATIRALDAAGACDADHRILLVDGGAPVVTPPSWDQEGTFPRRGPRVMLWTAFERAFAAGVDRLVFLQDDITPCRNAVRRMLQVGMPDGYAFMTFHDQLHVPEGAPAGLYGIEMLRGFTGALALAFPRDTLAWLVQQDPLHFRIDQERDGVLMGADNVLGAFVLRSPWPRYVAHIPRLVRHDGVVSAAHPRKKFEGSRVTKDFPGEDFDALALAT